MSHLPDAFVPTRLELHRVARLLGEVSMAAIAKLGLRANESGFATQDLNGTTYTVSGPYLTDGERALLLPGSTMRGVAEWMGVSHTAETDLDTPLDIDAECAVMLGEWFAGMQQVLKRVFPLAVLQLWPEHFDLAVDDPALNVGASPGDEHIDQPYLYAGPADGEYAAMPFSALIQAGDPLAAAEGFFSRNRKLLG